MRRVVMIISASLALAGCGSISMPSVSMPSMDFFKSTPPNVTVQLESVPPGADARTSLGPGCNTPCTVSVPVADNFTVSYTLDKYQPQTIPVQTLQQPGEFGNPTTIVTAPNPVFAELQPIVSPKKMGRKPVKTKKRRTSTETTPSSPEPAPAVSVFPPLISR